MTATLTKPTESYAAPILPEHRRSTSTFRTTDGVSLVGALVGAVSVTTLLFNEIAPFSGLLGWTVSTYIAFLGLYAVLVSLDNDGPAVRDRVVSAVVHSLAFAMLAALVFVLGYVAWNGRKALVHLNFLSQDMSDVKSASPLDVGGVLHAIVGTLEQIGIALVLTVPVGLVCAVFLSETRGAFTRFVRTVVEAMTALPSIVAGLFIYASLILMLGVPKSGFAAATALSVMMLPIVIRSADLAIRLVPGSLREASVGLGASQWRTMWHVVLPSCRSGLATAVILGTARGVGETSPVLLTAGATTYFNSDPMHDPQVSLPLAIFQLAARPEDSMHDRSFGAAVVLLAVVLLLFIVARLIGGRGAGVLSARQMRRRLRQSARDAARFDQS